MKKKLKVCIVRSMYNSTFELFQSANRELKKKNITASVIKVPGAFEIPVMIARNIKKYDGFIAIGCIIKGETPNFSLISNAIINGIMELSILHKKPIGNAIITCLNDEQAKKRIDKGKESVKAVLEVLNG
jgi:6,7-dimethyl-8-ribityllumazine synthase